MRAVSLSLLSSGVGLTARFTLVCAISSSVSSVAAIPAPDSFDFAASTRSAPATERRSFRSPERRVDRRGGCRCSARRSTRRARGSRPDRGSGPSGISPSRGVSLRSKALPYLFDEPMRPLARRHFAAATSPSIVFSRTEAASARRLSTSGIVVSERIPSPSRERVRRSCGSFPVMRRPRQARGGGTAWPG